MACISSSPFVGPPNLLQHQRDNRSSFLSSSFSFPKLSASIPSIGAPSSSVLKKGFVIEGAAWTRRSRGESASSGSRKSFKQRTDMYMRPFLLNVFFSKRFIHAKVMHRGTSKVISVATTNAKDLRTKLPFLTDDNACKIIGRLIAERSKEVDVYAIAYETRKNERVQGKLAIVLDTIQENRIIFV